MIVAVVEDAKDIYDRGFLNYALNIYAKVGSFKAWDEYLNTQPVCNWTNEVDYTIDTLDNTIIYKVGTEDEERYSPTMVIQNGEEIVYHSLEASNSMFFKVDSTTANVVALYVD